MNPKKNIKQFFIPKFDDPAGWWGALADIFWSVYYYPGELKTLVSFFNSMPEESVLEIASKLVIAHGLVRLKYYQIAKFLIKIATESCEKEEKHEDYVGNVWTNIDNKLRAIENLIKLNDARGKDVLFDMEEKLKKKHLELIIHRLALSRNKMGIKLYLHFADKYDWIKPNRERVYFERKLRDAGNKILNEYEHRKAPGFLFNIRMYALEDKQEFKNLIELFHAMPEDSEKHFKEKLCVAEILVDLDYKPVAEFFIKMINTEKDSSLGSYIYPIDRWHAAISLVKLEDRRAPQILEEILQTLRPFTQGLVADELFKLETNTSLTLLLELSKKYDGVKEYYNKDFVQEKIREILKNLDSKGKI